MIGHARDLYLGAGKIEIRRDDEEILESRRKDPLGDRRVAQKRIVDAFAFELLHTDRARGVRLRIEIDQKNAQFFLSQRHAKIDGRRGLAHSAFLVCDRDNFHERGTINVRNSKLWWPSASCQNKFPGEGNISVTSISPAFISQRWKISRNK